MLMGSENPVGFIQEYCMKKCLPLPVYEENGFSGPDHCRKFMYSCRFLTYRITAVGQTKKAAKREAAAELVKVLYDEKFFQTKMSPEASKNIESLSSDAVDSTFATNIESLSSDAVDSTFAGTIQRNPISVLQEFCQQGKHSMPIYSEESLPPPGVGFICQCILQGEHVTGKGLTKKTAKVESALKMLLKLNIKIDDSVDIGQDECDQVTDLSQNPISALNELCQRNNLQPPKYEHQPSISSTFVMKCTVEDKSTAAAGPNKQGAKVAAASKLLTLLRSEGFKYSSPRPIHFKKTNGSSPCENVEVANLPHFSLDGADLDSEEEEEVKLTTTLESLSLNDSVVEVEPSNNNYGNSSIEAVSKTDSPDQ